MIDRVGDFYDSYIAMGKQLGSLCDSYNKGIAKLRDEGHSISTSARQVMKFGVRRSGGRELKLPEKEVAPPVLPPSKEKIEPEEGNKV